MRESAPRDLRAKAKEKEAKDKKEKVREARDRKEKAKEPRAKGRATRRCTGRAGHAEEHTTQRTAPKDRTERDTREKGERSRRCQV